MTRARELPSSHGLDIVWRMDVLLANHSSYPRIGSGAILAAEHVAIDEVVAEQVEIGLDLVTDGQVRWPDPVSHLMALLAGVRLGGAMRFFDTDSSFRQPVVSSRVTRGASAVVADFRHARAASRVPVKAVLTGPYTLARLSVIEANAYPSYRDLAIDLSAILAHDVRALAAAGAPVIQIDEPAICDRPDDIRLLRQLFEPIYDARGDAQIAIATYFADADPLYPQLNSIPADIVALDLTASTALADTIAAVGASKTLALGVVDGRTTTLEDTDAVARELGRVLHRYVLDTVYLQPSCGLAFVSRETAHAKLRRLVDIRRAFLGTRKQ